MVYVLYTFLERFALNKQQGYKFSWVGSALRQFGKVHVLLKQLLSELLDIHNLSYCADCKTSEMRVYHKWLRVGVADNTYTRSTTLESVERRFELGAKIRVLQIVDGADESLLLTVHRQTATSRSEM